MRFGRDMLVSRRSRGGEHASEDGVYAALECNCDWEEEHGMMIVLRGVSSRRRACLRVCARAGVCVSRW